MPITIITDSTSDIPNDFVDRYGIIKVPLTVHFKDEEFKDGVDITPEQFFKKLVKSDKLPTTSQVTPAAFEDIYKRELEKGNSIISIHISSELSGTYQSAMLAKQTIGSDKISIVDSRTTTLALGAVVLKAAELALKGIDKDEIVREIEDYKNKVKIIIMVDTLEYLKKGGRLSGTQAMIGGILNIKPILTIEDGKVVVIDKVRGSKKALKEIIEIMKIKGHDIGSQTIGVVNAICPETVDELIRLIKEEFGTSEFIENSVGSVIATHAGPGAFGIIFV